MREPNSQVSSLTASHTSHGTSAEHYVCFSSECRWRARAFLQLFCDVKRQEVKAANPNAAFPEIAKLLGAAWKEASPEEKGNFQEQHAVQSPAL